MFQDIIAPVDQNKFDIEIALSRHTGVKPTPFSGLDKSQSQVCDFFVENTCPKGSFCPFRHVRGDKTVVCKHWLRGLCKKGDNCEFLHEFDMSKMPECYFYSKFNACSNKDCPFLHINPEDKIKECEWYTRGFCRHGPECKNRHTKRVLCRLYLFGFCPHGPNCKAAHPRFGIPSPEEKPARRLICHQCGEAGHKAAACTNMGPPSEQQPRSDHSRESSVQSMGYSAPPPQSQRPPVATFSQGPRQPFQQGPRNDIQCYKCGQRGHIAARCSGGQNISSITTIGR